MARPDDPRTDRSREASGAPVHEADWTDPDREAADEVPEPTTVWRAGHDRVATGPLRDRAHDVYAPEDEPLQAADDRPRRETRGRPATDAAGLSTSTDQPAKTPPPDGDRGDRSRSG